MNGLLPLSDLDAVLAHAERATALLERVLPQNVRAESVRLGEAFRAGRSAEPAFVYRPVLDLTPVIRALSVIAHELEGGEPWAELYRERALELWLEARIAEAAGGPEARELARERFPGATPLAAAAEELAEQWIDESEEEETPVVFSDDTRDPRSLVNQIRKLCFDHGVSARTETREAMACFAATGASVIAVREGDRHTEEAARRIAIHEVLGHALPRHHAMRMSPGLFTIGTRGGSEDEEGRALLLEERHGLLGGARRRQLALRHVLSLAARRGADFTETVRLALAKNATTEVAVSTALRVHRGGGLAREIVYLPAYLRVREAFARVPELERYLERGRISVEAARTLDARGAGAELSRTRQPPACDRTPCRPGAALRRFPRSSTA